MYYKSGAMLSLKKISFVIYFLHKTQLPNIFSAKNLLVQSQQLQH